MSGWINVEAQIDNRTLAAEGGASYGRSGESPQDNYAPKWPHIDEALRALAAKLSEQELRIEAGIYGVAPKLEHDRGTV